jgi:hypothetical protein
MRNLKYIKNRQKHANVTENRRNANKLVIIGMCNVVEQQAPPINKLHNLLLLAMKSISYIPVLISTYCRFTETEAEPIC